MKFLMRNLRIKTMVMNPKGAEQLVGTGLLRTVLLDVRAYGLSSAVSALVRDLRD